MRFTKKQKKQGMIALLILLVIVGIIFFGGFNKTFAIFPGTQIADIGSISEKSSDFFSKTYHINFVYSGGEDFSSSHACGSNIQPEGLTYSFLLLGRDSFPSGYYKDKVKAFNVNINGLRAQNHLGGCVEQYKIVNQTNTATCKYHDSTYGWECTITIRAQSVRNDGSIPVSPNEPIYYGNIDGSLDITLLKDGVECTSSQLSLCSEWQECVNNLCVEKQIQVYRLSNNQCFSVSILSSQRTSNDYDNLIDCQKNIITEPEKPQPRGILGWLQTINEWIINFFKRLLGLSITGTQIVEPNTQHTYLINMTAPIPDSDWTDKYIEYQFGIWGLVAKNQTILISGISEPINGFYIRNVTILTPKNIDNYALVGLITQINKTWDSLNGKWVQGDEILLNKEAIDIKTQYSLTEPEKPVSSGIVGFLSKIWDIIKNIWSSIFG